MQPHKPPDRLKHHGPESDYAKSHERLKDLLGRLEAAPDPQAAAPIVSELRTELAIHFAEEEVHDGVFTWLAAMDSSLGPLLRELEAEHARLLPQMDDLTKAASPADFAAAVQAFAEQLREHERREHEALARALGEGG